MVYLQGERALKFMSLILLASSVLVCSSAHAEKLKVTSQSLKAGGTVAMEQVFNGFGCKGPNVSPDLQWSGAPKDTKAFAITMYDPDAPTGSGWWHWTVINIPSTVTRLEKGASGKSMPSNAIEARTDFGNPGYGGPCPPAGSKPHRYIFKVFALKDVIPLDANAPGAMVGFYANNLKLAEGVLEAKFSRKE